MHPHVAATQQATVLAGLASVLEKHRGGTETRLLRFSRPSPISKTGSAPPGQHP